MTSGRTATVRAMHRRCCWPPDRPSPLACSLSLTSSHSAARRSADSTRCVHLGARQLLVEPDAEGDVLVDRHRERRRLLEHHADARAQQVEILARLEDVVAVEQHLALGALVRIEVVDAVEDAQQGRLAAAGRADEGRDLAVVERHVDRFQRLMVAVVEIQVPDRHLFRELAVRAGVLAGHRYRRRDGGVGGIHGIHDVFLEPASARAMMLSASTATVMSSAPVQASLCQSA